MTNVQNRGESLVQFETWNTKGMNSTIKRSRDLSYLKKLKADMIFLHETYL